MFIQDNVSLANFSTMRLGGNAAHLAEIDNRNDLVEAITWADQQNLPAIMIGIGSNIVWSDKGFAGLVLVNRIPGYQVFDEDEENTYVSIGGGANWDEAVARTVGQGLSGIEALSLIPGTAGATPVQNVGAYGQEISNTLVSLEAYDREQHKFVNIPKSDCGFGYRTSRFKTTDHGRFFIVSITLHLTRQKPQSPFYASVQSYFDEKGITEYSPEKLREAVITIRTAKLPDPSQVANNGSFFANPIVSRDQLEAVQRISADPVYWEAGGGQFKISAAWLLEQAGFKDMHDQETGMATWPAQPLVFVNENAKSTEDLIKFRQKVLDRVKQLFDVDLVQEPELLGE